MKLPKELQWFYEQIGYGFMCNMNKEHLINRLMSPHLVAVFRRGCEVKGSFPIENHF